MALGLLPDKFNRERLTIYFNNLFDRKKNGCSRVRIGIIVTTLSFWIFAFLLTIPLMIISSYIWNNSGIPIGLKIFLWILFFGISFIMSSCIILFMLVIIVLCTISFMAIWKCFITSYEVTMNQTHYDNQFEIVEQNPNDAEKTVPIVKSQEGEEESDDVKEEEEEGEEEKDGKTEKVETNKAQIEEEEKEKKK